MGDFWVLIRGPALVGITSITPPTSTTTGIPISTTETSNMITFSSTLKSSTSIKANSITLLSEFFLHNLSVIEIPLTSSREMSKTCSNEVVNVIENSIYLFFFTSFAQFINYDLSSAANGKDDEDAREQINQTNPYLDASMICGNNKNKVDELQTFKNQQMKMTDCRIKILQRIIYSDFLSLMIRSSASNFGIYQHDSLGKKILCFSFEKLFRSFILIFKTDATILNEFTIDTYNFSYALINDFVHRSNNQHKMIKELPLSHVIFRSIETFNQQIGGIDTLMFRYLPALSGKFDSMLNDVLRNHLFEAKKSNHACRLKKEKYIELYEKYKREYDHLSTLERVLGRTYDDLDHEQQGRLTVSHTAIQMIQQYYGK
ncbi:unnamed protein product [Rotaria sordida]|nr:unnamed protein product [Rotaria sordida]